MLFLLLFIVLIMLSTIAFDMPTYKNLYISMSYLFGAKVIKKSHNKSVTLIHVFLA